METRVVIFGLLYFSFFCDPVNGQTPTTGLIPLNDLKTGFYKSFQGGLYPGGENNRPFIHDSLGLLLAQHIAPLDTLGNIDPVRGKIVFLSVGMSNTTQEFSFFKSIADTDKAKNPKLIIVDGAQGGQTAAIISNPTASFWTVIEQRLHSAGVSNRQIQACWVKEADAGPTQQFPIHANTLRDELIAIVRIIKQKYANCRIVYISSRIYGGYATSTLNPEPYAYESGFSVKWVIEKQISGDTSLTYNGNSPKAPWLSWGPYFWADGLSARSDGLIWEVTDFVTTDGTHPSTSGRKKVAEALLTFVKTDMTAKTWFLKTPVTGIRDNNAGTLPNSPLLHQNYPNPFNPETVIRYNMPVAGRVTLMVFDVLGREVATMLDEYEDAGTYARAFNVRDYHLSSGVYFYQLRCNAFIDVKIMILQQ